MLLLTSLAITLAHPIHKVVFGMEKQLMIVRINLLLTGEKLLKEMLVGIPTVLSYLQVVAQ